MTGVLGQNRLPRTAVLPFRSLTGLWGIRIRQLFCMNASLQGHPYHHEIVHRARRVNGFHPVILEYELATSEVTVIILLSPRNTGLHFGGSKKKLKKKKGFKEVKEDV